MPVSIARKIQFYVDEYCRDHPDAERPDITVVPAVLTIEQVRRFGLFDEPIPDERKYVKGSHPRRENARYKKWKNLYGEHQGTVELDALEGSRLGRLTDMLDEAAAPYWADWGKLKQREREAKAALKVHLGELRDTVLTEREADFDAAAEAWDKANEAVPGELREAWREVTAPLRETQQQARQLWADGWDEAQPQLDEAWHQLEEAWRGVEDAWHGVEALWGMLEHVRERTAAILEEPTQQAEEALEVARTRAEDQLAEAREPMVDVAEAVEAALEEQKPDVDNDEEWAPPLLPDVDGGALASAMFHSLRTYREQLTMFKEHQRRHGLPEATEKGAGNPNELASEEDEE